MVHDFGRLMENLPRSASFRVLDDDVMLPGGGSLPSFAVLRALKQLPERG